VVKKVRYTEEQIIGVLKEAEAGMPIVELCRKHGISDATYYNWKAKYGDMTVSDAKKLKQLEDENRRLKNIVADLSLDNQALKAIISKNF
jgi:putative transposase